MKNLLSISDIKSAERDEKPIGLKLTKTQSLLKKLNKLSHNQPVDDRDRKAINFPVSCLQIGDWKVRSLHEGDLIVKCYFKKCKLVWEFLDPKFAKKLKKKIEIDWPNITAIKATFLAKAGILDIKLENPPKFFHELNPEPKKHTNWEETGDFTHNCQGSFISIHKLKFTPEIFEKFWQHVIHGDSKLLELSQRQFPTDNTKSCFNEIKFSRNHELLPQDAMNHHVINNHSDNQQYLLSQEMAAAGTAQPQEMAAARTGQPQEMMAARIGQPQVEPQSWSVGAMDFSGHGNQEGSNGSTLIESETTWDIDMRMLVDSMSNSSIPSLTTSGEQNYAPYIDDHCYYSNDQSQFASTSSMANLWSGVESMEFPGHDGSNSLNQFANRGDHAATISSSQFTLNQFGNRGDHATISSSQFTSSNFDQIPHHGQQLELPANYPMMAATQRSGLLPSIPSIQEPMNYNYNYGNNWGWTADYIQQPNCDYLPFCNTGIHGYNN